MVRPPQDQMLGRHVHPLAAGHHYHELHGPTHEVEGSNCPGAPQLRRGQSGGGVYRGLAFEAGDGVRLQLVQIP
eukprot:8152451-Alexandrium_andersonii.AAC.1